VANNQSCDDSADLAIYLAYSFNSTTMQRNFASILTFNCVSTVAVRRRISKSHISSYTESVRSVAYPAQGPQVQTLSGDTEMSDIRHNMAIPTKWFTSYKALWSPCMIKDVYTTENLPCCRERWLVSPKFT